MSGLLGGVTDSVDKTLTGGDEQKGQGGLLGGVGNAVGRELIVTLFFHSPISFVLKRYSESPKSILNPYPETFLHRQLLTPPLHRNHSGCRASCRPGGYSLFPSQKALFRPSSPKYTFRIGNTDSEIILQTTQGAGQAVGQTTQGLGQTTKGVTGQ